MVKEGHLDAGLEIELGIYMSSGATAAWSEEELVEFLRDPACYPHQPSRVEMIQTHCSRVFLAPPLVFKVKKPVNFGFLDFSTLEKRRHFCQREIDLNRRLTSGVYLESIPICRDGAGFRFSSAGEPVEYCIKMTLLPEQWFLSRLVEANLIKADDVARIIGRLKVFYESEQSSPEIEAWGRPDRLKISTDENFAQMECSAGAAITRSALETIRSFTDEFLEKQAPLFELRIREKRILDCHGDLRLDHVHLSPDAVNIFDCIEFTDRLRYIDVANDLAFLAMDFDFAGRTDLGSYFLDRAARELNDPGILLVADFYKCYRAFVRGKVETLQALTGNGPMDQEHRDRAARYFRLALRYAVAGSRPFLLAVMGRVGVGKTTVAQALTKELGWPIFSSDEIRKSMAGVPAAKRTPEAMRREIYSETMSERTYQTIIERGLAAAQSHGAALVDATFSRRRHRERLVEECAREGVFCQFVELASDDQTIRERLKARNDKADEISDARLEDFDKLTGVYEPPVELGSRLIVIPGGLPVLAAVKEILQRITRQQAARNQITVPPRSESAKPDQPESNR